jgi:hypothetical protein
MACPHVANCSPLSPPGIAGFCVYPDVAPYVVGTFIQRSRLPFYSLQHRRCSKPDLMHPEMSSVRACRTWWLYDDNPGGHCNVPKRCPLIIWLLLPPAGTSGGGGISFDQHLI